MSNGAKKTPVLTAETKLKPETKQALKDSFRVNWHKGIVLLEEGIKVEPILGTQTCDYGTFRCSIFREQTI